MNAAHDPWPGYRFPFTDDLPAGYTLTETSPGQWRLTVPVSDLIMARLHGVDLEPVPLHFHLDSGDPVALRRAAFGLANLGDELLLPELVHQIAVALGPDAEEGSFTAAFHHPRLAVERAS